MPKRITYWMRLKHHPGVEVMLLLSVLLPLGGLANEHMSWLAGILTGLAATIPFWLIVLWTARTQPVSQDKDSSHD